MNIYMHNIGTTCILNLFQQLEFFLEKLEQIIILSNCTSSVNVVSLIVLQNKNLYLINWRVEKKFPPYRKATLKSILPKNVATAEEVLLKCPNFV